jgi:ubiquinone/menaquinone biosynthesis C-methylase UbiE
LSVLQQCASLVPSIGGGDVERAMGDTLGMAAQLAAQSLRFGWYFALNRLVDWRTGQLGLKSQYRTVRPVPSLRELLADQAQLLLSDALAVRDGLYPPIEDEAGSPVAQLLRVREMLTDLPGTARRRANHHVTTVQAEAAARGVPDYYAQDFHFQTGGYLSEGSARLYDMQVETLFMGAAGPMRRTALRPIAEFMRGCDQRQVTLLDVGCGTGRFLRQLRLAYPAIGLKGLDLSRAYLDEARRHLEGLRSAQLIRAAAEKMPLPDASADILTCIFLYHELPSDVRRQVTTEIARILKPDGLFVFLDSLQMGDRPAWDGLIEGFPARFHEPYYRGYAMDDLAGMFSAAGLTPASASTAYLSKLLVCRKRGSGSQPRCSSTAGANISAITEASHSQKA